MPQDRGGDTILMQGATPLLRAARAGDAPFVELLLKHGALVDLPSKEGVTPLMAAAGVEFGTRVTRGRNRTPEGVLATMQLLLDAGANINARMVSEPRRRQFDGNAVQGDGVPVRHPRTAEPDADRRGGSAPVGAARCGRARLHAVREVPRRARRRSADEGCEGRTALDLAKGVGVAGVRQAQGEGFPETAKAIEALMAAKGIAASASR